MAEINSTLPTNRTIQLRDGRSLGYAEYGRPEGKALFYFHGLPGASAEAGFLAGPAKAAGVRLIGIDRPGMGRSTFQPQRHFLDWPEDVVELADRLQIERFAVAGFSGGSPYALACASKIPGRLLACGIISGAGLVNPFVAFLSQWMPGLMMPIARRSFLNEAQAQKRLAQAASRWIEADRQSLQAAGVRELMAASLVDGFRQGARGAAYEGALFGRPWGFKLEEIKFSPIYIWHGELDQEVPVLTARKMASKLSDCKVTYYAGEGHISTIVKHAQDILKTLV